MQKSQMKRGSLIVGIITNILIANLLATNFSITSSLQTTHGACRDTAMKYPQPRTSMALSGSNIYLTWWDNKTGNNEVFFASSTDNGKTFDTPINLKVYLYKDPGSCSARYNLRE